MNENDIIEEFGIEFAIQNIALIISKKFDEYKNNKSEIVRNELVKLIIDKEKIYANDKNTIRKYIKGNR